MTNWLITITMALTAVTVAVVAAIISNQRAYGLVRSHDEFGMAAWLQPSTVNGSSAGQSTPAKVPTPGDRGGS